MKKIGLLTSLVALVMFSACSSDKTTTNTQTSLNEGYLIDSPVEGVYYETDSGVKGFTDKEGKYKFKKGDKISFKVGKIDLGGFRPDNNKTISLIDFEDLSPKVHIMILQLLQSLDKDQNPDNGITITKEVFEKLSQIPETNMNSIDSEEELLAFDEVKEVVDRDNDGKIDINETKAKEHFEKSKEFFKHHSVSDFFDGGFEGELPGIKTPDYHILDNQLKILWNEAKLSNDLYEDIKAEYPEFPNLAVQGRFSVVNNLVDFKGKDSFTKGEYPISDLNPLYDNLLSKVMSSYEIAKTITCNIEKQVNKDISKLERQSKDIKNSLKELRKYTLSNLKALKCESNLN